MANILVIIFHVSDTSSAYVTNARKFRVEMTFFVIKNPMKANGFLKGHNNPITFIGIEAKENRLVTTSQDSVIRVWDISEQTCLLTLNPKTHRIKGDFSAIHFSAKLKCIVIATDVINMLQMQIQGSARSVK